MVKNVLGRGVGALLPEDDHGEADKFFMCDIDKISPNPQQPRSYFDADKLEQLPRAERRLREQTARADARKQLGVALAAERQRADEWAAPWIELERLGLMAQTVVADEMEAAGY